MIGNPYASRRLSVVLFTAPVIMLPNTTLSKAGGRIPAIILVQNDYGYQIPFTLEDGSGNPVNLTGGDIQIDSVERDDIPEILRDPAGTHRAGPAQAFCGLHTGNLQRDTQPAA